MIEKIIRWWPNPNNQGTQRLVQKLEYYQRVEFPAKEYKANITDERPLCSTVGAHCIGCIADCMVNTR